MTDEDRDAAMTGIRHHAAQADSYARDADMRARRVLAPPAEEAQTLALTSIAHSLAAISGLLAIATDQDASQ